MTKEEQARITERGGMSGPRTPHRTPRATSREIVSKILYLRQRYHFGPGRIASYLKRFHAVTIACSCVHRILGKHGIEPTAGESEAPTTSEALETLREAAARAPLADGREVRRAHPRDRKAALSVHCHRRLHTHPRAEGIRRVQSALGNPVPQRSPATASVPNPRRPNR